MSSIALIFIILIVLAIVIVAISIYAYNKRLDKVVKGEIHDTHSKIPEPTESIGALYKGILIALVILTLINMGRMTTLVSTLNNNLNNIERTQSYLETELGELQNTIRENSDPIASTEYEIRAINASDNKVSVDFKVRLKEYSEDTSVVLSLGETKYPLKNLGSGKFGDMLNIDLFANYNDSLILVTENKITKTSSAEFPFEFVYDAFPIPSYTCTFDSYTSGGKLKCSGSYTPQVSGNLENIESVKITYLSGGEVIDTKDITNAVKTMEMITLDKTFAVSSLDLTFLMEVTCKDGYKVSSQSVMIYDTKAELPDEFTRIYDPSGKMVWEEVIKN